jgi:hypothetical protein
MYKMYQKELNTPTTLELVTVYYLGRVWEGSGSTKSTLEQQLHQFAAPPWSWTLPLELRRCVWLRQQLQLRKIKI